MGVMTCDKKGCDNILCDTLVMGSYYICSECKEQFKMWLQGQTPLYLESQSFILDKFKEFMDIDKENTNVDGVSDAVDEFFTSHYNY